MQLLTSHVQIRGNVQDTLAKKKGVKQCAQQIPIFVLTIITKAYSCIEKQNIQQTAQSSGRFQ